MKAPKWILVLGGGAALVVALRELVFPDRATLDERVAELQQTIHSGEHYDPAEVLRDINRVLSNPETQERTDVRAALFGLRSEVRAASESYPEARADIEQQAALLGGATPAMVLRTAELEAKDGRTLDAWTRVNRLLKTDESFLSGWRLAGRLERTLAGTELEDALATTDILLVRSKLDAARDLLIELGARDPDDPRRLHLAAELGEIYLPHFPESLGDAMDAANRAATMNSAARASLARSFGEGPDPEATRLLIQLLLEAGQPELAVDLGVTAFPEGSETPDVFGVLSDALVQAGQYDRFAERVRTFPWVDAKAPAELCLRVCRELFETGAWLDAKVRPLGYPTKPMANMNETEVVSAKGLYDGLSWISQALALEDPERSKMLWTRGASLLQRFNENRRRIDPFSGAPTVGFLWEARCWRELGDERREREALGRALIPDPDETEDPEAGLQFLTGDDYLRHAELVLATPQRGARRPEEDWTSGMALLPERCYELLPRWQELGMASLAETGHDLERVYRNMLTASAVVPSVDVGPWARWELARMHLERGNHEGAIVAANRLLERYPHLLPGYDLLIEAQLTRGSRVQVIEDILARLAIAGPDDRHRRYLNEVGIDAFSPSQLLRLMQLDPEGAGRHAVAVHQLESGHPDRALRALGPAASHNEPETRLLRARALNALGRTADASEILRRMLDDPDVGHAALVELVHSSLARLDAQPPAEATPEDGAREEQEPEQAPAEGEAPRNARRRARTAERQDAVRDRADAPRAALAAARDTVRSKLASDGSPPRALALELVDRALDRGDGEGARELLEDMDSRVETRGGGVLWRLAIERWLAGDRDAALDALERAEASFTDGRVELARLVIAIEERDWRSLAPRVAAVRKSGGRISPLDDAILTVLEERLESGTEQAARGAELAQRSPEWMLVQCTAAALVDQPFQVPPYFGPGTRDEVASFLQGSEPVPRDPRQALALLLLFELPQGAPWAQAWIEGLGPESGAVWPLWARARLDEVRGWDERAEAGWRALTEEYPQFGPGWTALTAALERRTGDPWSREVLQARVDARRSVRRAMGGSIVERTIDEAAGKYLDGNLEGAAVSLATLLDNRQARTGEARALLARILAGLGRFREADREYAQLIAAQPVATDSPWVVEYIDVLERGSRATVRRSDRLEPGIVQQRLNDLQSHFPGDPLILLTLAELASQRDTRNPSQTLGMTLRMLDRLREDAPGVPLERMRAGSAVAWGRHLSALSPPEAEQFLLDELALTPGDLDLWTLLAEVLSAEGRDQDALTLLESILEMSDDPLTRHAYAWMLVSHGAPVSEVEPILDAIPAGEDPYGPTRGRLLRALADLRGPRPNLALLARMLQSIWDSREPSGGIDEQLVGRSYAQVLLLRGTDADLKLVERVLDQLERAQPDPYQRTVLQAFRGLAQFRATPEGERRSQEAQRRSEKASAEGDSTEPSDTEAPPSATERRVNRRNRRPGADELDQIEQNRKRKADEDTSDAEDQ